MSVRQTLLPSLAAAAIAAIITSAAFLVLDSESSTANIPSVTQSGTPAPNAGATIAPLPREDDA